MSFTFAAVWQRPLREDEIRALRRNPWRIFTHKKPRRRPLPRAGSLRAIRRIKAWDTK